MSDDYDLVELALVSALMVRGDWLAEVDLAPEEIFNDTYHKIYQAILDVAQSQPVDLVTVSRELERRYPNMGWTRYLSSIAKEGTYATVGMVKHYAEEIRKDYQKRQAVYHAQTMISDIDHGGMESVDECIRNLMMLSSSSENHEYTTKDMLRSAIDDIEAIYKGERKVIKTNINALDQKLGGLFAPRYYIVGARPSIGKTAWALNIALSADVPCAICSAEQPAPELGMRVVSRNANANLHQLHLGNLDSDMWSRISGAVSELAEKDQIYVYDKSGMTINDVARFLRKMKYERGIQMAIIDYVQIIHGSFKHRTTRDRVAEVSMALAELKKELDIAIIGLSQVNRDCEERANKRPMVSDLKEAGQLEQDADTIILLYRHEVYEPETIDRRGIIENNIAKNRFGPVGNIDLDWQGATLRMQDRLDQRR